MSSQYNSDEFSMIVEESRELQDDLNLDEGGDLLGEKGVHLRLKLEARQ